MNQPNNELVPGHPPQLWNGHCSPAAGIAIEENSFTLPNGSQRNQAIGTIEHFNWKLIGCKFAV
jgi:hypothetical protein